VKKHKARVHAIHGGDARRQAMTAAPPGVENRHTRELGHAITYELREVPCGKRGCKGCPHGPYWYAYWTAGGRVRTVYIGKKFVRVEQKCPEKLA